MNLHHKQIRSIACNTAFFWPKSEDLAWWFLCTLLWPLFPGCWPPSKSIATSSFQVQLLRAILDREVLGRLKGEQEGRQGARQERVPSFEITDARPAAHNANSCAGCSTHHSRFTAPLNTNYCLTLGQLFQPQSPRSEMGQL